MKRVPGRTSGHLRGSANPQINTKRDILTPLRSKTLYQCEKMTGEVKNIREMDKVRPISDVDK